MPVDESGMNLARPATAGHAIGSGFLHGLIRMQAAMSPHASRNGSQSTRAPEITTFANT